MTTIAGSTVLLVSAHYPPGAGDIGTYVGQLARQLIARHRARVVVVTARPPGERREGRTATPGGPIIYRLPTSFTAAGLPVGTGWGRRLRRIVAAEDVSLINVHAPAPVLAEAAAQSCGTLPFVLTYHSVPLRTGHRASDLAVAAYERYRLPGTVRRADRILCSSDSVGEFLAQHFGRDAVTLPAAADRTAFAAATALFWSRQSDRIVEEFEAARRDRGRRRIAVVTPYLAPKIGGVENYADQVARAVHRTDDLAAVVITSNHDGRGTVRENRDGVPVVRLGAWFRLSNTPINPLWPLTVRRLLRQHRIDLINAHAPVPYLADVTVSVAGRRPTALTYHSGSLLKGRRGVDLILRMYERRVLPLVFRRADALIAVSPVSTAYRTGRASLISPGVDTEVFTPDAAPAGDPTLLYVGRIERSSASKGIDVLVRAFAKVQAELPAARLVLVGSGDAVADHRALAADLGVGDRVTFAGELRDGALVAVYRRAGVLVLPSRDEAEAFGMALIEAMACGRPVVGSAVGGVQRVIEDGRTGLLVPPGDVDALAAACLRILTDPALAARMGAEGRRVAVSKHPWSARTDKTLELFRTLLNGGSPG
jgi:glycosyltransferase involved in cell wall biosynthesis